VKTTRIITATIALDVVIHAKCVEAAATAGIFATAGFFDCVRTDLALLPAVLFALSRAQTSRGYASTSYRLSKCGAPSSPVRAP
jgi:hypothetical protein